MMRRLFASLSLASINVTRNECLVWKMYGDWIGIEPGNQKPNKHCCINRMQTKLRKLSLPAKPNSSWHKEWRWAQHNTTYTTLYFVPCLRVVAVNKTYEFSFVHLLFYWLCRIVQRSSWANVRMCEHCGVSVMDHGYLFVFTWNPEHFTGETYWNGYIFSTISTAVRI